MDANTVLLFSDLGPLCLIFPSLSVWLNMTITHANSQNNNHKNHLGILQQIKILKNSWMMDELEWEGSAFSIANGVFWFLV